MKLQHLSKQIGPVNNETKSRPRKITSNKNKAAKTWKFYDITLVMAQ